MLIPGIVCVAVGGGFLIIFLIVSILWKTNVIRNTEAGTVVILVFLTFGLMLTIIGFSVLVQISKWFLFGYFVPVIFVIIPYIYSLYTSTNLHRARAVPPWLKHFWNSQKLLGGSVFGDFANTIGVLAGVGAYQLSNQEEGWSWLGQFGGFLAIMVALSLCGRSILEVLDPKTTEFRGEESYSSARWMRWNALANFLVGSLTALSATSPILNSVTNQDNFELTQNWVFRSIWWTLALTVVLNLIFYMIWFYINRNEQRRYTPDEHLPWYFLLVAALGFGSALVIGKFMAYPEWLPSGFGAGAIISWGVAEFAAIFQNWRTNGIKVVRSLLIVVGCLPMLYLTIWVAASPPTAYTWIHWFLFSESILSMIVATMIGIGLGIQTIVERRRAESNLNAQVGAIAVVVNNPQIQPAPPKQPAQQAKQPQLGDEEFVLPRRRLSSSDSSSIENKSDDEKIIQPVKPLSSVDDSK